MKKLLNFLKKVWLFLDGKKTLLSTFAASGYYALVQFHVVSANPTIEGWIATGIAAGLIHKVYKLQ